MEWQTITSLIGSVGFPIIACVYMFRNMVEQQKNHKIEIDNMTQAINNNTVMLSKLCERLGVPND